MSFATPISFEEATPHAIHKKVATGAFLGVITDGYILGIVGIALSYAQGPLGLNSYWMGLIGAGAMLGILFGSLLMGPIADRIGRRKPFLILMALSVGLSLWQFFITDPVWLAVVRFLLGMTVGADYTSGIPLLSEWTPAKRRARILSWHLVMWTLGFVMSYIVGSFVGSLGAESMGDDGWRWIIISSAVPGLAAFLYRFGTPESPSWLARQGRETEALELIHTWLGKDYCLPDLQEEQKASGSWCRLFSPELRYNTLVSGVFFAAQVVPFFAIGIFLTIVLEQLNVSNPHVSGILYNVFTMAGVLIGTWIIDKITRRFYLLSTFYGAAAILTVMILWQTMPGTLAMILLAALALVLAMSIVLEFAYPPELFPTELRASGVGLTVAVSRIGAGGGTFLLPVISDAWGIYASLWMCVGALLVGGIVCHLWAPETSGRGSK